MTREEKRAKDRAYYYANKEKRLEYNRKWQAEHGGYADYIRRNGKELRHLRGLAEMEKCMERMREAVMMLTGDDAAAIRNMAAALKLGVEIMRKNAENIKIL